MPPEGVPTLDLYYQTQFCCTPQLGPTQGVLVDVSDIFFFLLGERKGESEAPGGGGGLVSYWKSQEGGVPRRGGAKGLGGCCGKLGDFWGGGGLNIFFRAETSTKVCFKQKKIQPKQSNNV